MQEVYGYDDDGKKTHVNARLKQELESFTRTGFPARRIMSTMSGTPP